MRSYRYNFIAVLVGLATMTTACSSSSSAPTSTSTPITIGVIDPLSGPYSGIGDEEKTGALAAVNYWNSKGGVLGRKLQLTFLDSAASPTQSAADIRKLLGSHVVAIVGDVLSGDVLAEIPILDRASNPVPLFSGGVSSEIIDAKAQPWVFTGAESSNLIAQYDVHYLVDIRGFKHIGILYENDAYGTSSLQGAVAALKSAGLSPVDSQSFDPTGPSDTVQLEKLKASGADALFVFTFGPGLITTVKDMQSIGWSPVSVTAPSVAEAATRTAVGLAALANIYGGPVGSGLMTSGGAAPSPFTESFYKEYAAAEHVTQLSGEQINGHYYYDYISLLAEAMIAAKSTSPMAIRSELNTGMGFEGAAATYTYSDSSHLGEQYPSYGLFQAAHVCAPSCAAAPS